MVKMNGAIPCTDEQLLCKIQKALKYTFGDESYFEIEKGGVLMGLRMVSGEGTNNTESKGYKAILLRCECNSDRATVFTYLKAYNGAPVWTIGELQKLQTAFAAADPELVLDHSTLPNSARLCTTDGVDAFGFPNSNFKFIGARR